MFLVFHHFLTICRIQIIIMIFAAGCFYTLYVFQPKPIQLSTFSCIFCCIPFLCCSYYCWKWEDFLLFFPLIFHLDAFLYSSGWFSFRLYSVAYWELGTMNIKTCYTSIRWSRFEFKKGVISHFYSKRGVILPICSQNRWCFSVFLRNFLKAPKGDIQTPKYHAWASMYTSHLPYFCMYGSKEKQQFLFYCHNHFTFVDCSEIAKIVCCVCVWNVPNVSMYGCMFL